KFPKKMQLAEVVEKIKNSLNFDKPLLPVVGNKELIVEKVAICAGAGGDYINNAINEGCDLLITGDVKLHQAQYAKAKGFCIVDVGHFETEKFFAENFASQLGKRLQGKVKIIISKNDVNPYYYW
ncbi:MAG: Nif3-like dinuclear metal center hexameric protein, partial [Anaerovoracaceae bacterium]